MQTCDYSRSFVTFSVPGNNARIQLEARCLLTMPDGSSEQYLMFASCKSEDTYAERDLFRIPETNPNYDFSGMYSDTRYRLERIFADCALEHKEAGVTAERFLGLTRHVHEVPSVPLLTKQAIIEATLAHKVIIARNEISDPVSGVTQLLEYPVKTMNVHPESGQFQTDTGPLALYDFSVTDEEIMARFHWAYVACNDFTKAWFVRQAATPIVRDGAEVARTGHYSTVCDYPQAINTFFALED